MKPEQIKWTDTQWAAHLDCAVQEIPGIRARINATYKPYIAQNRQTKKYYVALYGSNFLPKNPQFDTKDAAIKYANNKVIPELVLGKKAASLIRVPQKALQMLHIEKQK